MSSKSKQGNQRTILFLLTQDLESPSGLGRYFPIGKNLAKHGFNVDIVALHSNFRGIEEKQFRKEGVNITYVGQMHVLKENNQTKYFSPIKLLWYSLIATWNLLIYSLKNPAEIIVIGKPHPMNSIAGIISGKFHRAKIILDCDDYETVSNFFSSPWQRWVIRIFENTIPKIVHRVITNTIFNKERMIDVGVKADTIVYLPNGVERERFTQIKDVTKKEIINKLSIKNHKFIAYIGSLSLVNHPVDLLLKTYIEIIKDWTDVKLLIVGGGKDIDLLKSFVLDNNLEKDVIFTGRVTPDMVPYYYDIADISVDPVYDTDEAKGRCPLKMFESWAMKTPFVTADVGDRKFLSGELREFTLATPGDPLDLKNKLMNILNDNQLSSRIVKYNLDRVQHYFWDTIIANNIDLFTCD